MEHKKAASITQGETTEQSDQKFGLFSYNAAFELAYLADHQRALLSLYTMKYNWANDGEVYTSLSTLARLLGRKDPETIGGWLRELEELGWVETELRYREGSDHKIHHVRPIIGKDNLKVATQARDILLKEKGLSVEEIEFISQNFRRKDEHEKYIAAKKNYRPRK